MAIIVVVAIYKLVIEPAFTTPQFSDDSHKPADTYKNSSVCQPCSPAHIKIRVAEIMLTVPNGYKARGGRSTNVSNACKRSNCVDLTNLCETKNPAEADRAEELTLAEMKPYPKCGNKAFDSRGGKSKRNIPISIYIKIYKDTQPGQRV